MKIRGKFIHFAEIGGTCNGLGVMDALVATLVTTEQLFCQVMFFNRVMCRQTRLVTMHAPVIPHVKTVPELRACGAETRRSASSRTPTCHPFHTASAWSGLQSILNAQVSAA